MKYLVEVFWSDDDEGHIAVVPDLPGCSAIGDTPEAAVHEIGDAILAWIAACRASGDPAPNPRPRPAMRPDSCASAPALRSAKGSRYPFSSDRATGDRTGALLSRL
jgi:predicted RNase H-like HicB family nuclease